MQYLTTKLFIGHILHIIDIYPQLVESSAQVTVLQSDGRAVACGTNDLGQCIPTFDEGKCYTVSPDFCELRPRRASPKRWICSTGANELWTMQHATSCFLPTRIKDSNGHGQRNTPPLNEETTYCQVSAGRSILCFSVVVALLWLLRRMIVVTLKVHLWMGMEYTQVCAGFSASLLQNDACV